MFTGIILHHGTVESFERLGAGARLRLRVTDPEPFGRGESLAVNGVCLTMLPSDDGALTTDLSEETLARTTLGGLSSGVQVNVERALALGDRLGGHIVQGHVDCVGATLSIEEQGDFAVYRWSYPADYAPLVVSKGSISVDGVSLTIVDPEHGSFGVALIPETLRTTNIGALRIGDRVNLEFDMISKYVRNLVAPYIAGTSV